MPYTPLNDVPPALHLLRDGLDPANPAPAPEVQLRIVGGMPSERLDLAFTLYADDTLSIHLVDKLNGHSASQTTKPSKARVDILRSAMLASGVLSLKGSPPPIPPDSVVGELHITSPQGVAASWTFIGDIDEAENVRDPAPLSIVRAVGPMMALGKEVLKLDVINRTLVADASGPLYVAAIDFDPPGRDLGKEHVVLYNLRGEPLVVGGYQVRDLRGHEYDIPPGTTIEPHGILRIWTGEGTATKTDQYWARKMAVWNNTGDVVVIRDKQRNEITRRAYLGR
jgi:hypothetical protein